MPLVRYEIRNEYSLAKPELYTSAARDDPDTLLEGVAMAGIVGIMRQLGDLAEFAAEIFHDLHEEVMATAAKGHELMVRVQQLEAEVPSIEKALMSETNQLQFAYTVGADWRANIQSDQIHLTQRDLPRFIWKSYEMCRGPPRLFVLDKFDVAGAGACLTRYTDPSFFRTEWANSQLRKAEKAQTVRTLARLKKKGRRRRNGETARVAVTSQQNYRFHFPSLDLAGPVRTPGNLLNTCNQTLRIKQHQENEEMVHERMGSVPTFQSLKISAKDIEAERMTLNIMQTEQKSVLVNGEKKREVEDDMNQVDDIGSEVDNFMDARTSMESEIETDSECQINQEVDSDINFEHRETGPHTYKKLQKQPAESSVLDVQSSTCFSELSNDSSKVNACIQIYNVKCADSFANVTSCTASQDSFENREPSSNLVSVDESTKFREEKSTTDLDSGNEVTHCLYSCGGNIVQKTDASNVEAESDHISLTSIATPADFLLAPNADFIQTGDAVLNRSPSFAFSNLERPSSLASILMATESGGIESAVSLDSSTHCENVVANISSQSGSIAQTGHASTVEALSDNFDVMSFTNAADVVSASSGPVQAHDTVLDRSSSFAFSNFELSDVSRNVTTSGRFDSADALFRFVTPELSIMYGDVKFELPILTEKLLATTEASAGVTDDKLETFSSDSERFDKSHVSIKSRDFNEMMSTSASDHSEFASGSLDVPKQNELKFSDEMEHLFPLISSDSKKVELAAVSDASELASGFDDALMQDESSCVDLDADYAESEMPGDSDCCDKEFSEHENPSLTSAASISAQLKVGAVYNESPAGNLDCKPFIQSCADLPSDSTYAEVHRSGMDIEPINKLIDAVILSGDALGLESIQMNTKAADPRQVELPPDLQNVQVPVGYAGNSLPETPSKQISGDVLGEQLIYWSDSSKGVGLTLEEDLNPDIFMKGIPIDLVQAELASGRHVDSPSGSASSANDCIEQLDEFSKDEIEVFLNAEYVVHDTTSPVDFLHSRSSEESVDVGSHTFSNTQTKTELLDEGHGRIFHDVPTASSVDHTLAVNPVHMEVVSKPFATDIPINLADESHGIYSREGLLLSVGDVSANAYELSSLEEDIKISSSQFALGTCPTMLSANDNYHPEVVNLEKSLLVSKITNLVSSFHVLTEHSSSVSRGVEEKSITDCVSLSSNNLEESSQIVVDEMQFSKLIDRDDGSECAQEKSFAEHSGSSNFVEIVSESAAFSGTMNRGIGSPRVPSNSASTNSSGASTPRDSILQRLDYCSVEEVYSGTPVGLSPGSSISTALPFSNSLGNSSHDMHLIATSQSMDIESELLVSSSLSAEPRFQRRNSQETPLPPPLPPLNWWITKPREGSLQYAKLVEPPAPPVLPPLLSEHSRPAQDPQSWKMSLERNDSLIRAIASYDKSMLRKVVRKTQSLKAKPLSEREELLHQIRTRSFSLRPTAVKKQEATKSATNINVTAILEKASAIRQAFMGSEDDEDDDWSDS